jgi:hypothetical protein
MQPFYNPILSDYDENGQLTEEARRRLAGSAPMSANLVGKVINEGGERFRESAVIPALQVGADTARDAGLGVLNFGRGLLDYDELPEGQRYRNELERTRSTDDGTPSDLAIAQQEKLARLQAGEKGTSVPPALAQVALEEEVQQQAVQPQQAVTSPIQERIDEANAQGSSMQGQSDNANANSGILTQIGQAAGSTRTPNTGNKRDAAGLSVPRNKIDLSEMLIRTGGAITGASGDGALAAIGAGTSAYGGIQDENRLMAQQQYDADMKAYQAEEDRKIQRMTARSGSAASQKAAREDAQTLASGKAKVKVYDSLINDLTSAGNSVTGLLDGTVGAFWDNVTGDPNANLRLRLQAVRVDAALASVAQTKGAISDREMSLFLSPMPTKTSSEEVWIDWMTMQRNVTQLLNDRMSGNVQIDRSSEGLTADIQAYADKYPDQRTSTDTLLTKYGIN